MNSQNKYRFLFYLFLVLILILTACTPQATPTPTIYAPGCSVSNLITYLDSLNANSPPAVINLDPGCVYPITQSHNTSGLPSMLIYNGLPQIVSNVTIYGNNAVIDIQGNLIGHFFIDLGGDLELYNLTLSNGARPFGGAVVNLGGDFFASGTTFMNNTAFPAGDNVGRGGAIYNEDGRVRIIDNSHFENNHAGETLTSGFNLGGAIYNLNGSLTVSNTSFLSNYAVGQGGAIFSMKDASDEAGAFITINETEFLDNYANEDGGALMVVDENSTVFIVRSEFRDNRVDHYGGAIFADGSHVDGTENDFRNNIAMFGGAVYSKSPAEGSGAIYTSYRSSFSENSASEVGGAIFSENADLTIDDVLMGFNTANSCGAISTGGDPSIDIAAGDLETAPRIVSLTQISDSHFHGNNALQSHGGAICHVMGDLSVQNTNFEVNSAVSVGGGLLLLDDNQLSGLRLESNSAERGGGIAIGYPGNFTPNMTVAGPINLTVITTVSGSVFNNNESIFRGGGIWSDQFGSTSISKTTFSGNTTKFGGGIYSSFGDLYITNSTFSGNIAWRGGGINKPNIVSPPDLVLKHSTFAFNIATEQDDGGNYWNVGWGGGALNVGGKASVINSLFIENLPMNCQLSNGMNYSESGSYGTDNTCGGTVETSPMITGLTYAGYPTGVHKLLPGSPLIDVLPNCASLPDDQRGTVRPTGAGCEPGSYELDETDLPAPPPMPNTSDCDPFADTEYRLVMLNVAPGSTDLTLYLKVTGGVQVALPAIQAGEIQDAITAMLGNTAANLCNLQGFDDRIYCMFTLPPSALGTTQDLKFFTPECDDPVLLLPAVSIPSPNPVCKQSLGKEDCKAAGGEFSEGRTSSTCQCP